MNPQILNDLQRFYPELAVSLTLLGVVVLDLALPRPRARRQLSC
ncbi:MAG TPA: hypothetical protein VE398_07360 [Acidobacteriota bacterium]|nr:hypothetical protein [Acidobacteriota bacterium]